MALILHCGPGLQQQCLLHLHILSSGVLAVLHQPFIWAVLEGKCHLLESFLILRGLAVPLQGLQAVTQPSLGQAGSSASPQVAFQVSFSSITAAAAQPTQVIPGSSAKPCVLL